MNLNLKTKFHSFLSIFFIGLVISGCSTVGVNTVDGRAIAHSVNSTPHPPLFGDSYFFVDTVIKNRRLSEREADEVKGVVESLVNDLISSMLFTRSASYYSHDNDKEPIQKLFLIEFNSFGVPINIYTGDSYRAALPLEDSAVESLFSGLKIPHAYTQRCGRKPVKFTRELLKFIQPVIVTLHPLVGGSEEDYFFLATTDIDRRNLAVSSINGYRSYLGGLKERESNRYKCTLNLGFSASKAIEAWGGLQWVGS
ncbi:hypothetical protein [Aliidiomarina quisquiliarum]|uniref:hypothetical protein n=1 Tax=Aliidiomarina quisquiliarum TaxID=2938947 RepID=UPI00208F7DC0|nr:hypothetical protein [Aliidiomarina quisquiliarum]MCO4320033.1 hypothetical protein [Aliidiomarina quisquiliarum]